LFDIINYQLQDGFNPLLANIIKYEVYSNKNISESNYILF